MKRTAVFVFLVLLFSTGTSFAQSSLGDFTIFGAVSKPSGDFGDDKGEDAGGAETGFGFGIEYDHRLSTPGMSWVTSASLIFNSMDINDIKRELESELGTSIDLSAGKYYNIPILTGLRIQTELSPTLNFYGFGLAGLNILSAPDIEFEILGISASMTSSNGKSFGYSLGGGLIFNDRINIGIRYMNMGKPEFDGVVTALGETEETGQIEQPVAMVLISAGIQF